MQHMLVAKIIMIAAGVWRLPLESLSKTQYSLYKGYCIFMQTYYFCFVICLYLGVFPVGKLSVEKTIEGIGVIILCTIILVKAYICQKKGVQEIIGYIIDYETRVDKLNEENYNVYKSHSSLTKYLCIIIFIYSSLSGVTLVLCKFIIYTQRLKEVSKIDELERPLPYIIWRPVDEKEHYILAFTLDVISASIGCSYNTVTQLAFLSILTFISAQLKILQNNIRSYGRVCSGLGSFEEKFGVLRKFILDHKKIIAYTEKLDDHMKYLILLEFSTNSLLITSILYKILFLKIDALIIFSLTFLNCMMLQMFLLAYYGNEIKLQSTKISQAVYECEWYGIPDRLKKILLLLMIRTQRPLKISVGPFFVLTIDTAVTSMKAAYSYFTLLKNSERGK